MQPTRRTEPTAAVHAAAATREEELRGSASRPVLEGYALDRVIAESAVGVVYLGTDIALRLPVAVKEYLPLRLARRHSASLVVPLPGEVQRFERGLRAFVDEARTLARCEHPSLLRVLRLIESHGSAYRVMPYHAGQRLDELRRRSGAPLEGIALRRLLEGLLDALQAWQLVAGVHGRVVPDNILVLLDGRPLLMGPGAVEAALAPDRRAAAGAGARAIAPSAGWPVGPWVDVHAVARVGRFCITGEWPEEGSAAAAEPLHDAMRRLGLVGPQLGLDPALVEAIAAATSPEPHLRPQSGAQLREWLAHGPPAALASIDVPLEVAPPAPGRGADPAVPRSVPPAAAAAEPPAATAAEAGRAAEGTPSPFETASDEVVIDRDVASPAHFTPSRHFTPSEHRGSSGHFASPARFAPSPASLAVTPTEPGPATDAPPASAHPRPTPRPVPQLTPELASLAGRLAAQRRDRAGRDAERGDAPILPGAQPGTPGGLARRSGLPTWSFALIALAVVVAVGVVLLVDQQPVRVEGWTPEGAFGPAAHEARPAVVGVPQAIRTTPAPVAPMDVPAPVGDGAAPTTATVPTAAPDAAVAAPAQTQPLSMATTAPASAPPAASEARAAEAESRTPVATHPSARSQHAPAAAPSKAARPVPSSASPREACGERTQFSLYRCMKTQCAQSRWHSHPQCVRLRKTDEVD